MTNAPDLLSNALQAAAGVPARATAGSGPGRVLVAGAAGALGTAVLEQLLARGGFAAVGVSTVQTIAPTPRGLVALPWGDAAALAAFGASTAVVVLDAPRAPKPREAALHRPSAGELPAVAAALQAAGVSHLLLVLPHDAARLPEALQHGLASIDEHAVAALGFHHVVLMRPARAPEDEGAGDALHRVARLMLSQLRFMVPQRVRPVRAVKVAEFAAALAAGLPDAPAGTRVVPAERVWQASQQDDPGPLARAWLAGAPLPALHEPRARW